MSCKVVKIRSENGDPDFTAVLCGSLPEAKRCSFCGSKSEILCDWPVRVSKLVDVASLKPGDSIAHPSRIVVSARLQMGGTILVKCEEPEKQGHTFAAPLGARISALVPGTCDKPACAAHHRSVGPGVDYCQEHWKAMEGPL